jgi:peptidoglycan/xylan/chitin deacetylase (PgdA/CDA1 family)
MTARLQRARTNRLPAGPRRCRLNSNFTLLVNLSGRAESGRIRNQLREFVMRLSVLMVTACAVAMTAAAAVAQKAPSFGPDITGSTGQRQATATTAPRGCANPNALGTSRVVQIDTTGGPGFGFEHFKMHDFLQPGEIVFTFDDGPWLNTTPAVLKALAEHCVRATFFPIGKHATYYPGILQQVAAQGHSVGSHTWSHANLGKVQVQEGKDEIEKGFSAVKFALGGAQPAPFFRFPTLTHPGELVSYLGERNVGIFSTDLDSFDFRTRKADKMIEGVMNKLKKHGKGIVLMHDFQQVTAHGLPELLKQLAAAGYKVVHLKAKEQLKTIAEYDALVLKDQKLPTTSGRPTASVVQTVNE